MPKDKKRERNYRMTGKQLEVLRRIERGEEDLSTWDTEELIRGRPRDKNGRFTGRPPFLIPREIHDELARRVKTEVAHDLRAWVHEQAMPIMKRIADLHELDGEDLDRHPLIKTQWQVLQDMLDRFVVARTENVEIGGKLAFETTIEEVTINRDEFDEGDIVDAEIVEDEEDDWDFGDDEVA